MFEESTAALWSSSSLAEASRPPPPQKKQKQFCRFSEICGTSPAVFDLQNGKHDNI